MADSPLVAVLAAGQARRFGGGKLNADCGGRPLGSWAIDAVAAAGLMPGVIVVGPDAPAFALAADGWQLLVNPDPQAGQGGSVALAAREALARGRRLLLLLADMPLIDPQHLRRLAQCGGNAATGYPDGRVGVPVCIAAEHVGLLEGLTGNRGAGAMLAGLPDLAVIAPDPQTLIDVDDAAALDQVRAVLAGR